MKNAIAWFEIPTTQLDRAQAFYEAVLGQPMRREAMGPSEGAVFAYDPEADGAGGALMMGPTAPRVSDSGTLVYLDASPEVRARRRADQTGESYDEVLQDLRRRDRIDSTRAASPLVVPDGAMVIDTSNLSVEEVVETMLEAIEAKS